MLERNYSSCVGTVCTILHLAVAISYAHAQSTAETYPNNPIRVVVPYPAGGVADGLGRIIGSKITDRWGQRVVVDNRPGANTLVGIEIGARAAPDGYTFLLTADQSMVMNPHLYEHLPYNPAKDFEPISLLASVGQVLCVHVSVPATSLQELIHLAKSKPGDLTYGSTGVGSTTHLNTELLKSVIGIDVRHVPYKGGGQAMTDLAGGHISMMIIATSLAQSQIAAATVRPLAVAGRNRSSLLPNVPTFEEAGVSGYEAQPWFGLLAPAGTPKEIVAKVNAEVVTVLRMPELQATFRAQGLDLVGSTPEEFSAFMKVENAKWKTIIAQTGVRLK